MRLIHFLVLLTIHLAVAKNNNVKTLTESLGREIIEIDNPIKELPPGLEEEPSAENDEDGTSTTLRPGTKGGTNKSITTATAKAMSRAETTNSSVDDEAKIERELAEMYKDNSDYQTDRSEADSSSTTVHKEEDNLIARSRASGFKFQPNLNSREEIERFRTSVDDISCDKVTQRLGLTEPPVADSSSGQKMADLISKHIFIIYLLLLK
ncbi:uncharacterized protein LOC114244335 [Bombyx mandarina]|uniref:Uncharacterized protein LOC114244335 n=1 Tax=Bombyx mandarina TaxID=7092 RepID=A0A6J2JSH7_BOMMA|nr:uncharacterized protein LOC114244335 [Bombyx mandarina]